MRLGVLDIGSNTVHLLLVDAHPGARPIPFASHKRPLQLVAHLDDAGNITERGQHELVEFVREARAFAEQHEAEDVLAFATSAIRESTNGEAVLERVHAETGTLLVELSGEEESAVTFLAVRRWFGWGSGTVLNLDIGGGSFELALGADEQPDVAASVPLGAARLTRELLVGDPPTATSVRDARRHVRSVLAEPVAQLRAHVAPTLVTGTSKTFRSLARITGAAPSSAGVFVRRELRLADLTLWASRLAAMSSDDRAALPGVSPARARQLLAGAIVAEAAMEGLGVDALQICPWALREGLILRRFDHLVSA
ncbi:Ppx/GppA phosphatase family protein [Compostimonas suwonensis]|uniref:Exopolyphosphatase/guanosine-5'-triphosphate, 3'-diphosphate pyrophosphatase n=1 Tax=Compostimonas suwonensis TaxID=1048394 RepID=A0A2M9BCU5_9MICO|nr:Ppx/GppA phosphatase family protein [Compostimonas suwonensis]PJJ55776.1 exopolyphosphatase/guanosine-5'-triphosphate,3'-diphosphate pyrophosphatase [Compostimonas suwonensis]